MALSTVAAASANCSSLSCSQPEGDGGSSNVSIVVFIVVVSLVSVALLLVLICDFAKRHVRISECRQMKTDPTLLRRQMYLFSNGQPPQWRLFPQRTVNLPSLLPTHSPSPTDLSVTQSSRSVNGYRGISVNGSSNHGAPNNDSHVAYTGHPRTSVIGVGNAAFVGDSLGDTRHGHEDAMPAQSTSPNARSQSFVSRFVRLPNPFQLMSPHTTRVHVFQPTV